MKGTVKTIVPGKPFGFIAVEGAEAGAKDLFFHESQLSGMSLNDLQQGDMVSFDVVDGEKGPSAINVSKA